MHEWFLTHHVETVCGLLMPNKTRRAFFALRAFNVELASVKGSHNLRRKGGQESGLTDTPTTIALQMRMQWWKDALGEIYGERKSASASDPALQNLSISCWNSPIVRALDHANQQVGFTRRFLDRLIEARAMDLEVQQLATLDDSINYAEETVSSLLYLSLESLDVSMIPFLFLPLCSLFSYTQSLAKDSGRQSGRSCILRWYWNWSYNLASRHALSSRS